MRPSFTRLHTNVTQLDPRAVRAAAVIVGHPRRIAPRMTRDPAAGLLGSPQGVGRDRAWRAKGEASSRCEALWFLRFYDAGCPGESAGGAGVEGAFRYVLDHAVGDQVPDWFAGGYPVAALAA